jgi:hypothetical protein
VLKLNQVMLTLIVVFFATSLLAQAPTPQGGEFPVNTTTADEQQLTATGNGCVAMNANGNFVVVWMSNNQDGSGWGVYARLYDNTGTPTSGEILVNSTTANNQRDPAVAMDATGNFVVAWNSFDQDQAGTNGIYAQRFSSTGTPAGTEFPVNSTAAGHQFSPSVAMDANGNFVVAWTDGGLDGSANGIFGRLYDNTGATVVGEFLVNTNTGGDQTEASAAMDADGDFVVTWMSFGQDGSNWGIYGQLYDEAGATVGSEFLVNTFTAGDQANPSAATEDNGDFLVAWNSLNQDAAGTWGIYCQRFDNTGTPVGSEFRANSTTADHQYGPAVALDGDGDFIVTWMSLNQDGSGWGVYGQFYDTTGATLGTEFRANTEVTADQWFPSVGIDDDGEFVVAWQSFNQDAAGTNGVYAQRYSYGPSAPTIAGTAGPFGYNEGGAPLTIASAATVTDPDSSDFDGGFLRAAFGAVDTDNRLTIATTSDVQLSGTDVQYDGGSGFVTVGTIPASGAGSGLAGNDLEVTFNASSSPAAAQAILRAIQYTNTNGATPNPGPRTITFTVDDGDVGASNTPQVIVNVTAVNDGPDAGRSAGLNPISFASLGIFNPASNVTVNTTTATMSGGASFTGVIFSGIAVFCFSDVDVAAGITLDVSGSRPFALLSKGSFVLDGSINANASGTAGGPGGHNAGPALPSNGIGPGGGTGNGSGGAGGAFGGNGGRSSSTGCPGGNAYGNLVVTLEGGSGGGSSSWGGGLFGGGGGGAVELGASGSMTIGAGAQVNCNGASGATGGGRDGGGGGAGGGIRVHAYTGTMGGALFANGGAGGPESGSSSFDGGGGGGGRILLSGLAVTGTTSVNGGTGPGSAVSGSAGSVLTLDPTVLVVNEDSSTVLNLGFVDPDIAQGTDVARADLSAVNGTLTLGTIAGLSFISGANGTSSMVIQGLTSDVSAAVAGASYAPPLNYFGSDTIVFIADDRGNFGTGGILAHTFTINVTVNPVNDQPSVTGGGAPTSDEDDGPVTIPGFVGMDAGAANESGQVPLAFSVVNLTPAGGLAFATAPSINTAGDLSFETASDSFGTATFQVRVQDNGGTANGGVDLSAPSATITITVNPVNDAPSFTAGLDPAVPINAGPQTYPAWATAMDAGAANESGQLFTFIVNQTGTTGGLTFATAPAINGGTGDLTFEATAGTSGTATFDVTVQDNGGTAGGGVNTSAVHSMTITVVATPATVYVNLTWTGTIFGTDPDAGGPAQYYGIDSFDAVQPGVNAVADGGVVIVATGNYLGATNSKNLTLNLSAGPVLRGASPVITHTAGTMTVTGGTSDQNTAFPTILITGGTLILDNHTVLEDNTATSNQFCVEIQGGVLDTTPGNNVFRIRDTGGGFIQNQAGTAALTITSGVSWQEDATTFSTATLADNYSIEDRTFHALDNTASGLVTWVANNVYVTTNTLGIQRGHDAASANNTVNVAAGTYVEEVTITKALTVEGPNVGLAGDDVLRGAEAILQPVTSNPSFSGPGEVNVLRVLTNNVTVDGLMIDGDNPSLTSGFIVNGADVDARVGISNVDITWTEVVINNLLVQNCVIRNFGQRGIYMYNTLGSSTEGVITRNLIQNFNEAGIIMFQGAYFDITDNAIEVPNVTLGAVGIHWQEFSTARPGNVTTNWTDNSVTVDENGIGILVNQLHMLATPLNIEDNTVNAVSATPNAWGIAVWGAYNPTGAANATVTLVNNDVGTSGGNFDRGVDLWFLPTITPVSITGGTIANSQVGINFDDVSPFFGSGTFGAGATVDAIGITVDASCQIGAIVRSATVGANAAAHAVTMNVTGGSISGAVTAMRVVSDSTFAATINTSSSAIFDAPSSLEVSGSSSVAIVDNSTLNFTNSGVTVTGGDITLTDSTLTGGNLGVSVSGGTASATVTGTGVNAVDGVNVSGGTIAIAESTLTVSNSGVTLTGGASLIQFTNNSVLTFTASAIFIDSTAGAVSTIVDNFFDSTGTGIDNQSGTPIAAVQNYWGSARGPALSGNPGGIGASIIGNVTFSPWWASGTDNSGAPGFQGGDTTGSPSGEAQHAVPTVLVWTTQPPNGFAGVALSPAPTLRAQDGSAILGYNFNLADGDAFMSFTVNPTGATMLGNGVQGTNGVVTFGNLRVSVGGFGYQVAVFGTHGPFTVNSPSSSPFNISNLAPTITAISPTFAHEGSGNTMIQVDGTNFGSATVVRVNGSDRPTFFISTTQVLAIITVADLASPGNLSITVNNPPPGGGTSSALTFVVNDLPSALLLSNSSVAENQASGTAVGSFSTTDTWPSPESHTYALAFGAGSTDNSSFSLTVGGVLSTAASFNFEVKSSYSIRVRSTDFYGAWIEQTFNISVTDVNEAPTAVADSYSVNEDTILNVGVALGVVANDTDPENNTRFATLVGPAPANTSAFTLNADGSFSLTPSLNFFGTTSFDYQVNDGSLTGNTVTVTITVNSVNDAPSVTGGSSPSANEDAGPQSIGGFVGMNAGAANEAGQVALAFNVINLATFGTLSFSSAPAITAAGTLTFTTSADTNGSATFQVQVQDNGGGTDTSAPSATFTITVNAVNDVPSFNATNPGAIAEDPAGLQSAPGVATGFNPGGGTDESTQTANYIVTNISNGAAFATAPSVDTAGELSYEMNANFFGTFTFDLQVQDNGGGTDISAPQTVTITVTAVNDAPGFVVLAGSQTVTVLEDAGSQTVPNWVDSFNPGPMEGSQSVLNYQVTLIGGGALLTVAPAVSNAGTLNFTPVANANGNVTFTVTVFDDGGAPGTDSSGPTGPFTISITAVNDAPNFSVSAPNSIVAVAEDSGLASVSAWSSFAAGPTDESTQAVDTNGYTVFNVSNTALFSSGPAVSDAGVLTFTPNANAHGTSTYQVTVRDDGGTANGGVDTSAAQTFTIMVTPVNDAPTLTTIANFTGGTEDTPHTITFAALETAANEADVDGDPLTFRIDSLVSGSLTMNGNPVTPGTTVFSTGSLLWTPTANVNGSAIPAFTVLAWDGLLPSSAPAVTVTVDLSAANDPLTISTNTGTTVDEGSTGNVIQQSELETTDVEDAAADLTYTLVTAPLNGDLLLNGTPLVATDTWTQDDINTGALTYDHDDSQTTTDSFAFDVEDLGLAVQSDIFSITVNPINDAPTLSTVNNLSGAFEDQPFTITYADLVAASDEADVDNTTVNFLLDSLSSGSLLLNGGAVTFGSSVIAAGDSLSWTSAADANGSLPAFMVMAWDGALDSGTPVQVTVNTAAVNDAPAFSAIGNPIAVNEDSGAASETAWASVTNFGPADENGQGVQDWIIDQISDPGLFSVSPDVVAGTLTYTPAANAFGSSTFRVRLQDNGGTANGGVDTSSGQTFTITVNPVNDAPNFSASNPASVLEDAGPVTQNAWALFSAGPANESGQSVLTYLVTNLTVTSGSLTFVAGPSVSNSGNISFEASPNTSGTATFDVAVRDNGGGTDTSATQGFTLTVQPVNDEPSFTVSPTNSFITRNEDTGPHSISNWAAFSAGAPDESAQTAAYSVTNVTDPSLFSAGPAVSPSGTLTFTLASNANGISNFEVTVQDNGGTANGGDDLSGTSNFTILVNAVNDAPTLTTIANFTGGTEDTTFVITFAALQTNANEADVDADPVTFRIQSVLSGTLTMNSNPVVAGTTVFSGGQLEWTPALNASGSALAAFAVSAWDGLLNSSGSVNVTVDVAPVNDNPFVVVNQGLTLNEGATGIVSQSLLEVGDVEQGPGSLTYTLDSIPANGQLLVGATPLNVNDTFAQSLINGNAISYVHNGGETTTDSFTFHVVDNVGGTLGSVGSPLAFAITITPVNDVPVFTSMAGFTGATEDVAFVITHANLVAAAAVTDPDGPTLNFRVDSVLAGTLTKNGSAVTVGVTLVSAGEQLEWTPPANQNNLTVPGSHAAFTVRASDSIALSTAQQTVNVNVNPVNDIPNISAPSNTTRNEDTGANTITGWATMLPGGGSDEATQTAVSYSLTNVSNPALFSAGPAVNAAGTLSFTLVANAFGVTTFDLTVTDNGTPNLTSAVQSFTLTIANVNDAPILTFVSTMFGGPEDTTINVPWALLVASANETDIDSSPINFRIEGVTSGSTLTLNSVAVVPGSTIFTVSDTLLWTPGSNLFGTLNAFTISAWDGAASSFPVNGAVQVRIFVEGVNDEPSFTASNPAASLEDAGSVTVFNWATFDAGPNETTTQAVLNYTVSNVVTSVTGNLTFVSGPSIDNNGNLSYQAAANTNGTATFRATVRDTGGTASGGDDTGQLSAVFTITVTAVNDAPAFSTTGNPASVNEDSGVATVTTWASVTNFGPANESTQAVTAWIVDQVSDTSLFSVQPAVSVAGTLTYTPAANAFGTSTFRVRLQDNGGTANSGVDTSAGQTFTITINPINDAPSVTGGSSPTVAEDAGAQSITSFVGMNAGPANESSQTALAFTIQNLTPSGGLTFSSTPAISAAGTLTFTAAANSNGLATFQVRVQDNGGTASGGVDLSGLSGVFTITVTPVNDAPTMTTFSQLAGATEDTAYTITYAALQGAGNEADIDSTPVNFRVESVIAGTLTKNTVPVTPGSTTVAAGEQLVWTPPADLNGIINAFTLAAFDGSLVSTPAMTAQVSVAAVNDPPSFTKGSDITVAWDQGAQSIVGWATAISAGPTDEAGQGLTFNIISNNNPALFTTQPAISSTGTLTFTPAVNASGTAAISIELQDNAGGSNTSAPQSFNITITTAGEIDLYRVSGNSIADGSVDNLGSTIPALTPGSYVYTIENLGNGNLALVTSPDPVQVSGISNCEAFVTHQALSPLAPAASTTFVLWVRPLSAGGFSVDLSIASSDANENPYDVTVSGTAVIAPNIEISRGFAGVLEDRATDHMGSIPAGVTSSFTYDVANVGTGLLTFGSPAVSVISETNCTVTATPPSATIAASGASTMVLDILPSVAGSFSFEIQIDSDDPDEPSVVLYGEGVATAGAQPELELFGRRVLSPADTENAGLIPSGVNTTFLYEARNAGSAPLTVNGSVTITGVVNAVVVLSIAPGATVNPGQMTPFGIDVQPLTPGPFQFDFELVTSDADESPLQVNVQGQGTAALVPEIALDRDGAAIADGGTDDLQDLPGSVFSTFVYRIRNEGTSTLNVISPVRVFGETGCVVRILRMPNAAVAPQDDTDVLVGVMPTGTGAFSAILRVDSNDSNEGQYFINLIGTGPQPDIQVEFPRFTAVSSGSIVQVGNRTSGQASLVTLFVRNTGTGPLTITSVTPSVTTNVTGALVSSGASPISPNGEVDLILTVTPTANGPWSITFTIVSNDPDTGNFDITIEGTGVPKKNSGGDGGDDSSCSTGSTTGAGWLVMLGLLSAIAVSIRSTRRKA